MYGLNIYAIPAVIAALACLLLLYLTHHGSAKIYPARLYRVCVLLLFFHNLNELALFVTANTLIVDPWYVGVSYYALSFFASATLAHLSLAIATGIREHRWHTPITILLYTPAILIQIPLWFTRWLIVGYVGTGGVMPGVAWNSIHGPGYLLVIGVLMLYMLIIATALLFGTRSANRLRRLKSNFALFATAPLLVFTTIIIMQLLRIIPVNPFVQTTFSTPFGAILFLAGTGYAIFQHRLVDIEFYFPWTRGAKQKRVFYQQIQTISQRLPYLHNLEEAMQHISAVLGCAVVVRSSDRTVMTTSAASRLMSEMPMTELEKYARIITVAEIIASHPSLAETMRRHRVFAAVPVPQGAASGAEVTWVLLGEELAETVYSSRDFLMVNMLFQRMENVLVDRLGDLRSEITEIQESMRTLCKTTSELVQQVQTITSRMPPSLRQSVVQGTQLLALGKQVDIAEQLQNTAHGLLYLGRDRALYDGLRAVFPEIRRYARPGSTAFLREYMPAIVIYDTTGVTAGDEAKLIAHLNTTTHPVACYVLGNDAARFLRKHGPSLHGVSIYPLPTQTTAGEIVEELRRTHPGRIEDNSAKLNLNQIVAEFEKSLIEMVLAHVGGNQSMAARMLDLTPPTLHHKIVRLGILADGVVLGPRAAR